MDFSDQPANLNTVWHLREKSQSTPTHPGPVDGRILDDRDICDPVFCIMEFDCAEISAGGSSGAGGKDLDPVGMVFSMGISEQSKGLGRAVFPALYLHQHLVVRFHRIPSICPMVW